MIEKQYQEIKEQVPSIEKYPKEIKLIEEYLNTIGVEVEQTTIVFWNHIITLLERIDSDEQNDLEIEQTEVMSQEAVELTEGLREHLRRFRKFDTTSFENYLLTIYFEQIKNYEEN